MTHFCSDDFSAYLSRSEPAAPQKKRFSWDGISYLVRWWRESSDVKRESFINLVQIKRSAESTRLECGVAPYWEVNEMEGSIPSLISLIVNRHAVVDLFDCQPGDLRDKNMNQQNVKRSGTELIPWVEMIEEPVTKLLKYELRARVEIMLRCVGEVKRFRTELLHRVGGIILLNPTLPESGDICQLSKCKYGHLMNCSANAVSSSVLVRMFECGDRDDAFFD
ncbi:Alpha-mannosidase 2x [Orobanche gracilis]